MARRWLLVGRRDEVSPYGMIIPGESGSLSGLLDVGKTIIGTISGGITDAQQALYDAVLGVFNKDCMELRRQNPFRLDIGQKQAAIHLYLIRQWREVQENTKSMELRHVG